MKRFLIAIIALQFVVTLSVGSAIAAGPDLQALMIRLADVSAVNAYFRETRTLAALTEPLLSSGILRYRAPDTVIKKTLLPRPQLLEIDGDSLLIDDPDRGRHRLALQDYPAIAAFAESFRATLAGDLAGLTRFYQVALSGDETDWQLHLKPRDRAMAEYVETIIIGGQQARILTIETLEPGGDRSVMTITPIND